VEGAAEADGVASCEGETQPSSKTANIDTDSAKILMLRLGRRV